MERSAEIFILQEVVHRETTESYRANAGLNACDEGVLKSL
jgi:hypothetical protein